MLFYGGIPRTDLPFLWQLKHEVETATEALLQLNEYQAQNNYFHDGNNPKFTSLAYILANKENEMLCKILDRIQTETRLQPIFLLFDGAIVETSDENSKVALKRCIERCQLDLMVKITINM